ncbi:DUF6049 family protein [Candidatus Poriferisocius sp.]|uniref:DUF6049 family protein n=1 Tax=Candidatus Poriferisocius sp. TaxID=3101276 RepID=UPI003B0250E5
MAVTLLFIAEPMAVFPAASAQDNTNPEQATPSIELVSQSIWVAAEDTFQLSLRLLEAPNGSTLDINIGAPIRSRTAFLDRLAEPFTSPVLHQLSRLPIPEPGPTGISSLSVVTTSGQNSKANQPDRPRLFLPTEGVYPVNLDLRGPDGARLGTVHTFLVRTPPSNPELPPLLVSTVLSVSGPPAVDQEGNVDLGPTGPNLQTLADVLDPQLRPQHLVTVSLDPHLIDALALSRRPEHTELLARLRRATASRHITSNTYVPLDSNAWIDQNLSLQIGWQIESGAAVVDEHLGHPPDRTTMVLTTSASPELLQRLRRERVRLVLVPEALLDPVDDLASTSAKTSFLLPAVGDPMPAVAIDSTATAHFSRADDSRVAPYLVLADLAARWFEDPQQRRGIVLAPPMASLLDPDDLGTLLDEITTSPILAAAGPAEIVENLEPGTLRQVRPAGENGFGEDYEAALSDGQRIARSYQNMVDPIATAGTPERQLIETLERALLLSGAYGLTETQRDSYLGVVAQTVRDTVAAIQPPSQQRITLTSRSGTIPMLIRNNLDYDVIVRLDLNSDKLDFPDGDSRLWRLSPGVTQVQVAVRAKTSGDAVLKVSVNSPTGLLALGESQLTVRTTSLSGTGVGIAAAALAILLVWWARNWWSRRR